MQDWAAQNYLRLRKGSSKSVKSAKKSYAKSCCSSDKPTKLPVANTGPLDSCYSETERFEESAPKIGCPGDKYINDNNTKSISADLYYLKVKPIVEPLPSGCAGSYCRTTKIVVIKKPLNAACASSYCKSPK
jgi:Cu2+-exporting ATPase